MREAAMTPCSALVAERKKALISTIQNVAGEVALQKIIVSLGHM